MKFFMVAVSSAFLMTFSFGDMNLSVFPQDASFVAGAYDPPPSPPGNPDPPPPPPDPFRKA